MAYVARSLTMFTCALVALTAHSRTSHAWAIGSQLNTTGCHEPITAQALRNVRTKLATAPTVTPSRDEAALIDDVLFLPPADFIPDLGGMTLLLGVRDNDLKGINPLSSLDLVQVHGNPDTQQEHCIRAGADDGAAGDLSALVACQAFIRSTVIEALDGLDASGKVDASKRIPFTLYVALAGKVTLPLPVYYVKMGAAMHALEDSFTHTYRTDDGMHVTVVLNWIDLVQPAGLLESRDGPPHRPELDHCWKGDPLVARNYQLAIQAVTDLLTATLDPSLTTRDAKLAQVDAVLTRYLTYQAGCTADNKWCDAPEAKVTETFGCNTAGGNAGWLVALLGLVVLRRRRRVLAPIAVALLLSTSVARADRAAATEPVVAPTPVATPTNPKPVVPSEPGREIPKLTVAEVKSVRKDKQLGSTWGFAGAIGASIDRAAAVFTGGARYRLSERWIFGADAAWNPWITTSPLKGRGGVATIAATVIRRFPMQFDRVNLRSSLHLGVSTLLFDVYGAPKFSTGPYFALCPLGIDYDLGGAVRLVIDPVEFALPVPLIGQLPLYYEQFRFMIGIQVGS